MVAKRVLFPATDPLAKRIRRIEKVQRQRAPEKKSTVFGDKTNSLTSASVSVFNITQIAQGDSSSQREGKQVRVRHVSIRGVQTTFGFSYRLIVSRDGTAPTYADFAPYAGGGIQASSQSRFYELGYSLPASGYPIMIQRKMNLVVKYNGGTTSAVDNAVFLVIHNPTGTSGIPNVTAQVTYTDC